MQILPFQLKMAGSKPGTFMPVPQAGMAGPLFSSILDLTAGTIKPTALSAVGQSPFPGASSGTNSNSNTNSSSKTGAKQANTTGTPAVVNAADSHVPITVQNIDEMRQVKVTQEDFAHMRDKLAKQGVSKDTLDQIQSQVADPRGMTWGEMVYTLQQSTIGQYMPKSDLSSQDKQNIWQFFSQVGFDAKQSDQLTQAMQSGKAVQVMNQVSQKLSQLSPDQTTAISADEIQSLGKAMNLPDQIQQKIGSILGQAGAASLSADQIGQALQAVKGQVDGQFQKTSQALDDMRTVVMPQIAQARQHFETIRHADNTSTIATQQFTKASTMQDAPEAGALKATPSQANSSQANPHETQAQVEAQAKQQNELREHGQDPAGNREQDQPSEQHGQQTPDFSPNSDPKDANQAKSSAQDPNAAQQKAWADLIGKFSLAGDTQMAASAVAAQAGAIAGQAAASAGQAQTQVPAAIPAPPAQIVNQVQSAIVNNLGQGTQQLTLSLTPESLGTLNVVLTVKGKEVQALIKADTPDATKVISENLSQIKQSLESQGLTVSKMEVQTNLAQDSTLGQQWSGAEQHNQAQERREGLDRMRNTALLNQDDGLAQDMQTMGVQENFTRSGLNVIA